MGKNYKIHVRLKKKTREEGRTGKREWYKKNPAREGMSFVDILKKKKTHNRPKVNQQNNKPEHPCQGGEKKTGPAGPEVGLGGK